MDMLNKEDDLAHDKSPSGPPTLSWSVLDFGTVLKGSQKTVQQVITNTTRQPMIWLADTGEARWLCVEPDHGVLLPGEQRSLRITANTASLAIGKYSVTVTFSSEGDTTSMSNDTISTIGVKESPRSPKPPFFEAHLDFGELKPHSTRRLKLLINNPKDHPVKWKVTIGTGKQKMLEDENKPEVPEKDIDLTRNKALSLSKEADTLPPNKSQAIYVTVNTAPLEIDYSYKTTLNITSTDDDAESVQLPISFYVSPCFYDNGPKPPCGTKIDISIPLAQPSGEATLCIPNDDDPPGADKRVTWELISEAAWLKLISNTGEIVGSSSGEIAPHTNQTIDMTIDMTVLRAELRPGTYTTDLHLTLNFVPPDGHTTECDIPVTVTVQ